MRKLFNYTNFFKNLREILLVTASSVLGLVINLAGLKYLTSAMSIKTFGELSLFTTIYTLGSTLLFGPVGNGIARYVIIAINDKNFFSFEKDCFFLIKQISLTIFVTGLISSVVLALSNNRFWCYGVFISTIYAIALGISGYYSTIQLILRERSKNALISVLTKFFPFFFACFFIVYLNNDSILALLGYVIGIIVVLPVQFFMHRQSKKLILSSFENKSYKQKIIDFSYPYLIWGVIQSIQFASERWALNGFCDIESVGYYTVLNQVGYQSVSLGFGILNMLLMPLLFNKAGLSLEKDIFNAIKLNNKIILLIALCSTLFFPIIYFFATNFIELLTDKKYILYAQILPLFYTSSVLFNLAQMLSVNFTINLEPNKLLPAKIFTMLLSIILNLVLSKFFAVVGVVISSLLSSTIYFFWMLLLTKRLLYKPAPVIR